MRLSSLIGWATLTLVGVVFVLPVVAYGVFSVWATIREKRDNPRFARTYFAEILPFDEVVATRRWHNDVWGCTYAIVRLPDDASLQVPVA